MPPAKKKSAPAKTASVKTGRPPTGNAIPGAERTKASVQRLIESGGRKLHTTLDRDAAQALDKIKTKRGYTKDKDGVVEALHALAKKL